MDENQRRKLLRERDLHLKCHDFKEALSKNFQSLSQPCRKPFNELKRIGKKKRIDNMKEVLKWIHENVLHDILRDKFMFEVRMTTRPYREFVNELEIEHINEEFDEEASLAERIQTYINSEKSNLTHEQCRIMNTQPQLFPSLTFMLRCKEVLNSQFNINFNSRGCYYNTEDKIKYYIKIYKEKILLSGHTIHIRIAGDGTFICKRQLVLNVGFGFLNPINETGINKTNPNCVTGNFIIGLFNLKTENYEELQICLKEIVEQLSSLTEVTVDEQTFQIVFHLGGDLKFLALVLGINAANSNHPCPICTTNKKDFACFDDCSEKIRTFGDQSQPGQTNEPIFNFIPVERVKIDLLHMKLRITDKFETSLHRDLYTTDSSFSLDSANNQKKYSEYLQNIGIKRGSSVNQTQQRFEFRNLEGKEKDKIFENIDLESLFPDIPQISDKNKLWKSFYPLLKYFKEDDANSTTIHDNSKIFLELFTKVHKANAITPYIHMLAHIPMMNTNLQELNLNLNMFSMEGFEKSNSFIIKYFHHASNKKTTINSNPLLQTLNKLSKMEQIRHSEDNVREILLQKLGRN